MKQTDTARSLKRLVRHLLRIGVMWATGRDHLNYDKPESRNGLLLFFESPKWKVDAFGVGAIVVSCTVAPNVLWRLTQRVCLGTKYSAIYPQMHNEVAERRRKGAIGVGSQQTDPDSSVRSSDWLAGNAPSLRCSSDAADGMADVRKSKQSACDLPRTDKDFDLPQRSSAVCSDTADAKSMQSGINSLEAQGTSSEDLV